jgi:hypothetical protein
MQIALCVVRISLHTTSKVWHRFRKLSAYVYTPFRVHVLKLNIITSELAGLECDIMFRELSMSYHPHV